MNDKIRIPRSTDWNNAIIIFARETRLKRMTVGEGQQQINNYVQRVPKNLPLFLAWIGMTERAFNFVIDQHRSPTVWKRNGQWQWELKSQVSKAMIDDSLMSVALDKKESCEFVLTPLRKPDYIEDRYVLIGKGYAG